MSSWTELVVVILFALWAVTERIIAYRERHQLLDELSDVKEEAHKRELALLRALKEAAEGQAVQAVPFPSPAPHPRRQAPPQPPENERPAAHPHMNDEAEALYEQMRAAGMSDEQIMDEIVKRQKAG